ncbi:hypothetical protein MRB53_040088 [Persea americana]|nr:hypothetical protein MRB53_040088 [Persea americana]
MLSISPPSSAPIACRQDMSPSFTNTMQIKITPMHITLLAILAVSIAASPLSKRSTVQGFDISHYQGTVDFDSAYDSGARFVIIKPQATEGTTTTDSAFSTHYTSATNAGFIRGGYHFAHPSASSGSAQADFFLQNGGAWSDDGITLPGMLDLEANPSGATCYGLSQSAMVDWIGDFVDEYEGQTGRWPMIYTTNSWWSQCTGDSEAFSSTCPLVLARYASAPGTVPGGWGYQTIWVSLERWCVVGGS